VAIERKMEVSIPVTTKATAGVQSPLPRRRRTFHVGERRIRTVTLARSFVFETTPATLAGSLSTQTLPPDVNRREIAEDDGPDPQRLSGAHPVSNQGPAARLVHPPRRAGDSNATALPAQSLAATPDP
jgi:hypothetical protein